MRENDTIAAVSTGFTDSGIGIVRISGPEAVEVGNRVFRLPGGSMKLKEAESHVMYYGFVVDENNHVTDEVMSVVMKAPRSYTGEDTVEIQCHGGVFVMKKILNLVLNAGARLAEPGEFTKRAFLNGRMDLSRAEAVMDMIHSRNEYALASSVSQLRGSLFHEIEKLRGEIIYEIAFIESALDDPEHISLEGYPERLREKVGTLLQHMKKLIHTADNGKWIKEGINTVIVGKPNAGKSSLLNCLVGEERAIVTDIAGTTRDVLTESVILGDVNLNMVDTAGIRRTEDRIEKIGVEKAKKYAEDSDLILYVVDASSDLDESDREIVGLIENKKVIVLLNKNDMESKVGEEHIRRLFSREHQENEDEYKDLIIIRTSAKDGTGLDEFERWVKELFFQGEIISSNEVMITNMRHKQALQESCDALVQVVKSIDNGMPEDFYSIDLMSAYSSLGYIIGQQVDDDLVEEIFSKFCMGK